MKEILREIGMIARALDSISNIEFKEYDLTKGQYLYLVRICENPGIIQEKVAELIKVDRTTAARAIKKLEMNGFIVKARPGLAALAIKLVPHGARLYFSRGDGDLPLSHNAQPFLDFREAAIHIETVASREFDREGTIPALLWRNVFDAKRLAVLFDLVD